MRFKGLAASRLNAKMLLFCHGSRRRHPKAFKHDKAQRTPDLFLTDTTIMEEGHEACLTEGERFVATTAKFDELPEPPSLLLCPELQIIPLRPELRLEGCVAISFLIFLIGRPSLDPEFQGRKETLV